MADVVIIGAGITGLSCAVTLQNLGIPATILEASNRAGGVIRSERTGGYLVEWGPNSLLPTEDSFRIMEASGISQDLIEGDPRAPRYIYFNGGLRKAPFGVMSIAGMIRMLSEGLVRTRSSNGESVAGFFTRRLGREAHDRLIAPFMAGVYAGNTADLSISAVMPRMVELERTFGSLTMGMLRSPKKTSRRTLRTASFADGMETLPQRLAQGLTITFNVKDAGIRQTAATVLTAPAYHAAGIVERQHPYLARLLERAEYAPILSVTTSVPDTSFPKPLRGFGFLVPRSEGLHILGTLFSSALFPGRAPQGSQLLTTFVGGAFEPEVMNWPDDRVWEVVASELQRILKTSVKPEPVKLIRQRNAIPQYNIGHDRWVRSLREELKSIPGLFIAGNYIEGISVAACMEQGEKTAHAVADYLRRAK